MEYDIEKILTMYEDDYNPSSMVQGPRNMYAGGQLVQLNADGSRPGYSGDYTDAEKIKQNRIYTIINGKRTLDLNKDQKKWYNKTHKNNPNSRYYQQDWHEQGGKKSDLLDSYFNEQKREKPPKGYITTKEFSKKYGFPIYEKRQYGPITKTESNFINNALMKTIGEKEATRGRKNLFLKKFLTETLVPKQFDTLVDLGDGKKSVQKVNYVKDNAALAKKAKTYIDSPFIQEKTRENMVKILKNDNIKTLFNRGDYKGLVKALEGVKGLTNAERANALLRISQAMSGVNFRDFDHGLKPNKPSANKIFRGLEKAKWGDPYADAYRDLKRNTIKDAIGDKYFTKSYGGFLDDAKKALNKSGIDTRALNLDLNELTGLNNAYKNKTFNSSQFINFMDSNFNSEQHASMIKEYGKYENKLQNVLKGKKPNFDEAAKITKDWRTWKNDWFDRLDPRMKTDQIKSILPDFKLGADAATKAFTTKRLDDFRKQNFPIEEEIKKMKYAKTFGTKKSMSETPILKEVASGDPKVMEKIKKQLIALCPKGKASGGRIGFAEGPATLACGRKALDKGLATGKWESPEKAKLAKKILQTAGKSGLAGKIGSRLAAELLGPVALASIPVFELGIAGYDTVTAGTPFKEAVNKTLLHYVAGDKWKADPEKLKRKDILKMSDGPEKEMLINLWSNMGNLDRLNNLYEKQYDLEQNKDLSEAVDIGEYGDEGVSVAGIDKQIKDVENQIQRAGGEEAFYNLSEAAMDPSSRGLAESKEGELLAKRKADSLWGSMPNPYYTSPNSAYKGEVKPERIEAMKARGPSYGMWSPAGEEYEKLSPEYIKFLNEYYASEGIIPKDGDISQYYVATPYDVKETSMLEEEQIANKWKQLMSKPGMLGTQETFAGGGIASIRRPNAIPPESGPTPQGLPSMYNRVKRI